MQFLLGGQFERVGGQTDTGVGLVNGGEMIWRAKRTGTCDISREGTDTRKLVCGYVLRSQ